MLPTTKPALRPCFSCADKNVIIKDLQTQIGRYKRKIDELEGTWFSPARMKEIQKKLYRSEHCRDALIAESRSQRSLIKEQSEALHKVYLQATTTRKIVQIPIKDADELFPAHHDISSKLSSPAKRSCKECVETQLSSNQPDIIFTGTSQVFPMPASASKVMSINPATSKPIRRQMSRAERKRKQRERMAAKSNIPPTNLVDVVSVPAVTAAPASEVTGRIISAAGVTWEENASEFFDLAELLAATEWKN